MPLLPKHLLRLLVALGWVALASGCQPDAAPTAPPVQPVPPLITAGQPASGQPFGRASNPLDSTAGEARLVAARQRAAHLDALPRHAWSRVSTAALCESTEGGEVVFYYLHGQPQKITVQYLGETGQQQTTFYLLAGQPTLVLERTYRYNRPITWDSATARANADSEVFDFTKSSSTTTRSYFDHGRLLSQTGPVAADSALAAGYQQREQQRLTEPLHSLLALP